MNTQHPEVSSNQLEAEAGSKANTDFTNRTDFTPADNDLLKSIKYDTYDGMGNEKHVLDFEITNEQLRQPTPEKIHETLDQMGLDEKTKTIIEELTQTSAVRGEENALKAVAKLFKEKGNEPEFKKAVEAMVEAASKNGIDVNLSVRDDGMFVMADNRNRQAIFKPDGTYQMFEKTPSSSKK